MHFTLLQGTQPTVYKKHKKPFRKPSIKVKYLLPVSHWAVSSCFPSYISPVTTLCFFSTVSVSLLLSLKDTHTMYDKNNTEDANLVGLQVTWSVLYLLQTISLNVFISQIICRNTTVLIHKFQMDWKRSITMLILIPFLQTFESLINNFIQKECSKRQTCHLSTQNEWPAYIWGTKTISTMTHEGTTSMLLCNGLFTISLYSMDSPDLSYQHVVT